MPRVEVVAQDGVDGFLESVTCPDRAYLNGQAKQAARDHVHVKVFGQLRVQSFGQISHDVDVFAHGVERFFLALLVGAQGVDQHDLCASRVFLEVQVEGPQSGRCQ